MKYFVLNVAHGLGPIIRLLKLASVLDNRHVEEVLEEASERAKGISKFLSQLQAKYKTVEGPAYASRILADYLTR